jgi:hypothetical protein
VGNTLVDEEWLGQVLFELLDDRLIELLRFAETILVHCDIAVEVEL